MTRAQRLKELAKEAHSKIKAIEANPALSEEHQTNECWDVVTKALVEAWDILWEETE